MKNVRILDCTLRDGGRIINCEFPNEEIKDMAVRLANARIDIVEVGFLRDWRKVDFKGNSTFFTDVDQIKPYIQKKEGTLYVAFIDYGMFDIESLKPYDGTSIDGIRFGFTKKNYDEAKDDVVYWAKHIQNMGYKLFVQGVNSLNYSDRELLEIVDMINDIHPYSFGIVDTYGAMYIDDVDRLYSLIDHNMLPDICINFHSHNNYQLSFGFAQEVIKLSGTGSRQIIIDATLGGMGKVAGNLNTELIVDFMVRKKYYDYDFEEILDLLDDYIYPVAIDHKWGYSTAAMMAGIYKSHPNNVIYLTEKFRLQTKDIGKLLSMIDPQTRQRYDYDNIEKIYTESIAEKIDDKQAIEELKKQMEGKEIFVMVPGNSLNTEREKIDSYIVEHNPVVISVSFVADVPSAIAFFGNQRRYAKLATKRTGREVIITSNVKGDGNDIKVNYHSLINRGYRYFENSTIMLLNLLKKVGPKKITIAGFDGFNEKAEKNYSDDSFQNDRHVSEFAVLNAEVSQMFSEIVETLYPNCTVEMITPSVYEEALKKVKQ